MSARHARTDGGPSPALLATGVVLVIVAAVGVLYVLGGDPEPAPEVEAEEVDPFEDLPPEEPPGK